MARTTQTNIQGVTRRTRSTGTENLPGVRVATTKGITSTIKRLATVRCTGLTGASTVDFGKMDFNVVWD